MYVKSGCRIYRCERCGVGRADPGGFDPNQYYTADYFEGGRDDGYADYAASQDVLRQEFAAIARRLKPYVPPRGTVLEIGCAYGFFLQEARRIWSVYGIEISAEAVAHCHATGLPTVEQGEASDLAQRDLPALDAVVMLDVIEHLPDPFGALRQSALMLKPGGVVYLSTGDFSSLYARVSGPRWRLMTPPQHLWFLTPRWLDRAAAASGLEVVSLTHPTKRVPLSLVLYQLRRLAGLRPSLPPAWLNRLALPINLFDAMHVVLRKRGEA